MALNRFPIFLSFISDISVGRFPSLVNIHIDIPKNPSKKGEREKVGSQVKKIRERERRTKLIIGGEESWRRRVLNWKRSTHNKNNTTRMWRRMVIEKNKAKEEETMERMMTSQRECVTRCN